MQLFTLIISLILLTIPRAYSALNLVPFLRKKCPKMSEITSKVESQKKQFEEDNPNQTFPENSTPESCQSNNYAELMRILWSDNKCLATGSFGKTYEMKYINPSTKENLQIVTKVVRFPGDRSQATDARAQISLANEIDANQYIFSLNLGKYFVPEVFGCLDFTEQMDSMKKIHNNDGLTENQMQNLALEDDQGVVAIFMEKLSISLHDVIKLALNGELRFPDQERFNLFYQAVIGLEIMDNYFLHCDIKPKNMMLKEVTEDEIKKLENTGIPIARFSKDEHYLLNFIDFGLISIGDKGQRECFGGTPGFMADEVIEDDSLDERDSFDEKEDIYSLGMSFLDFELAERGLSEFSKVDWILKKKMRNNDPSITFEESDIKQLNKKSLVKRMKKLMTNDKYRPIFLETLETMYPAFKLMIDNNEDFGNYKDLDPTLFLENDVKTFRHMMTAAITVYFDKYIKEDEKDRMVKDLDKQINEIKSMIKKQDTLDLQRKKRYYRLKKALLKINKKAVSKTVQLCLEMISVDVKLRASYEKIRETLVQIISNYDNFKKYIKEIYSYEDQFESEESSSSEDLSKMVELSSKGSVKDTQFRKPALGGDPQEKNFEDFISQKIDRHLIFL